MKKKLAVLFIILLLISTLMVGCGGNETPVADNQSGDDNSSKQEVVNPKIAEMEEILTKQLAPMPKLNQGENIGVLVISLTNPFWVGMKDAYEAAGNELGINIKVMSGPTEGDKQSQLETLDAMVVKDYDAIVLSPIEGFNLIPGIVRANEGGIPVVNLGPGVNLEALANAGGLLDGRITVDFITQGKMVAEDMLKKMPKGGKVAIIQGIVGAGQSEGRTQGAKEIFESTEGIELVSIQPGDWDSNKAYNITKDLIQAQPDLKAIFACNDVMALATVEALTDAGIKDDVIVYGVDFTKEAAASIKEGKLNGTIGYSSSVYAKAALLLALKTAQGHDTTEIVYSPLAVVNQENIGEFDGWK